MFSGIVAATGRILSVSPLEDGVRLTVDVGALDLDDVQLGDSIANSGVCLTVVALDGNTVQFDVSRETLNCTVGLDAPAEVNLEKALRLADRLGGHLVLTLTSTRWSLECRILLHTNLLIICNIARKLI